MSKTAIGARCEQLYRQVLPRLSDYVAYHARTRPDGVALIEHDTGAEVSWKKFDQTVNAFAAKLLAVGLRK